MVLPIRCSALLGGSISILLSNAILESAVEPSPQSGDPSSCQLFQYLRYDVDRAVTIPREHEHEYRLHGKRAAARERQRRSVARILGILPSGLAADASSRVKSLPHAENVAETGRPTNVSFVRLRESMLALLAFAPTR